MMSLPSSKKLKENQVFHYKMQTSIHAQQKEYVLIKDSMGL